MWFKFGDIAVQPTRYGTILIDAADLPEVSKRKWHVRADRKFLYVRAWLDSRRTSADRGKSMYLHDFLMSAASDDVVDFVKGNGLDCRRSNLRIGDKTNDACNRRVTNSSSGFLGVDYDKARGKWRAQIGFRGHHKFIGRFDDLMDAVAAREQSAKELHGEFASTLNAELLTALAARSTETERES